MGKYTALALTFVAMACSDGIVDGAQQLSIQATTSRPGNSAVKAVVTVTNTSNDKVEAAIGGDCPFNLLAYPDASRTGRPVWNEADWRRENNIGCTYKLPKTTFSPGESVSYETTVAVNDILSATTSPDGRYYFVAAVHVGDRDVIRLPAGDLQIEDH